MYKDAQGKIWAGNTDLVTKPWEQKSSSKKSIPAGRDDEPGRAQGTYTDTMV